MRYFPFVIVQSVLRISGNSILIHLKIRLVISFLAGISNLKKYFLKVI